jgi:hypothetical protein
MDNDMIIRCDRCTKCFTLPGKRHLCEAEHIIDEARYPNPPARCLRDGSFVIEQPHTKRMTTKERGRRGSESQCYDESFAC